jgi:iron complex outermembrane receptor protein
MKLKIDFLSKCGAVLLLLLATVSFTYAQRTISGTVTDAGSGEPLIGANVLILGTSTGTITDFDGNFSMEVPDDATTLRISYTGYADQEIDIANGTNFDIQLAEGTALEEIVVTGYGTAKSREVTSSIASIKEEDFNNGNINDPSQLLQGKVAGLTISRPGSNPNGGFNIRLRGLSSLGANVQPLIVIDGVLGADLNTVDPNDIASIDVLKDASATAIYGTRGAAGVILVTTKRGDGGAPQVNYEGFVTAETVDRFVESLSASEFRSFTGGPDGSINTLDRDEGAPGTDWFDEITDVGLTQVHSLSLGGGGNGTSYRVSANYRDIDGIAINTGNRRLNGRASIQQKALNDRLTLNADFTTTNINADLGFNEAFRYATIYNPTAPVRSSEAEFEPYDGYFQRLLFDYQNPVALLEQNLNERENRNTIFSFRGTFELLPDLNVSAFYSQDRRDETLRGYRDKNSLGAGLDRNGLARLESNKQSIDLFELTGNYELELGGTELRFLGGYSYQDFLNNGYFTEAGDFITDAFGYNNLEASQDFLNGRPELADSYRNTERLIAFFGRVSGNIDDTYFFTASLRQEGSSRFGDNNKWGLFPGISAGVDLRKLLTVDGVDNLKLRAGYGQAGNRPGESYLSLRRFQPGQNFFFNGAYIPSYEPASNENPDLRWETRTDISVGLDFALMDFRFTGTVDYFNTKTDDLLYPITVSVPPNFFPTTNLNIGELENSGLELVLNYGVLQSENLTWNTSFNGTYFLTNRLNEFLEEQDGFRDIANLGSPGQNDTPLIRVQEGTDIGNIWGLEFEGIGDDGAWQFADNDGNGVPGENTDRAIIGQGLPDFQLGWNNSFTFGDFDFNFFLRGAFGHDLVNTFRALYEAPQSVVSGYNLPTAQLDEVRELSDAPKFSSFHVEDADFLVLDNASLGYTFGLPENSSFRRIRLYVAGNNLFWLTNYSGVTPEVRLIDDTNGDGQGDPLAPGIDRRNTYFTSRAFTFGLQLGF